MKRDERDAARCLRSKGYSINAIVRELGVSKASVSKWVRDVTLSHGQRSRLNENGRSIDTIEKRRINRIKNTQARHQIIIEQAKREIEGLSAHELLLVGAALYWGEGSKTSRGTVGITNSDPDVIAMMMRFLREICSVPEDKFRGHVHTFSHLNAATAERYWSNVSNIPRAQFYKTYSKPSIASKGKKDSLPHGTFQIYVHDTTLHLRIKGLIERMAMLGRHEH